MSANDDLHRAAMDAIHDLGLTLNPEQRAIIQPVVDMIARSASIDLKPALINESRARARQLKPKNSKTNASKRPLNAFMAFRAYYSPLLKGLPQKFRSPMLSMMWKGEQRPALFHLLGVAYSILRDKHHAKLGLDKFLAETTRKVSVIPVEHYLDMMGWEFAENGSGEKKLLRKGQIKNCTATYPLESDLSPEDVVQHCFDIGLAKVLSREDEAPPASGMASMMMMPFASAAAAFAVPHAAQQTVPVTDTPAQEESEIAQFAAFQPVTATREEFNFNNFNNGLGGHATDGERNNLASIGAVTADQQKTFGEVPFGAHFHPGIFPPILSFDPTIIQDSFDPFSFQIEDYGFKADEFL